MHNHFIVWLPEKPKIKEYALEGKLGKGSFVDLKAGYQPNKEYPDLRIFIQFGKLPLEAWNLKTDRQIALTILLDIGEGFTGANYWNRIYPNTKKVSSPIAGDTQYLSEFKHLGSNYKIRIIIGRPYIWVFMSGTFVLADDKCKQQATKFWQSIGLKRDTTCPPLFKIKPGHPIEKEWWKK
jgi:hypothetical protein